MVSLDTLLLSERQKLLNTIDTLTVEISIRPKGSLVTKKRGRSTYVYLVHREKEKVKTDYLGKPLNRTISRLAAKIQERKRYESELKKTRTQLAYIEYMLAASEKIKGNRKEQ